MNWEAIGALGEIVGALAVVATLFYLAQQIRHNTRMARAEMTKDLYLASRTAIMDIASSDRLSQIWADIRPFADDAAANRHTFYQSFFRLYELQFNLAKQGLVDETLAASYVLVIRMWAKTRHFDAYWAGARQEFHDDFASYVDRQIEVARAEVGRPHDAERPPEAV
jgi:integral membrane sensor domain MASE1